MRPRRESLIPKSAAERYRGDLALLNGGGSGADLPPSWHEAAVLISNHVAAHGELTGFTLLGGGSGGGASSYRWCWTCGLRRVAPWRLDADEHRHPPKRLPCGCPA